MKKKTTAHTAILFTTLIVWVLLILNSTSNAASYYRPTNAETSERRESQELMREILRENPDLMDESPEKWNALIASHIKMVQYSDGNHNNTSGLHYYRKKLKLDVNDRVQHRASIDTSKKQQNTLYKQNEVTFQQMAGSTKPTSYRNAVIQTAQNTQPQPKKQKRKLWSN